MLPNIVGAEDGERLWEFAEFDGAVYGASQFVRQVAPFDGFGIFVAHAEEAFGGIVGIQHF